MNKILEEIEIERNYQLTKYSESFDNNHSYLDWVAYILRRFSLALLFDKQYYEDTFIEVAAMCIAAVQSIRRKNGTSK
jgi:hypothetical protein